MTSTPGTVAPPSSAPSPSPRSSGLSRSSGGGARFDGAQRRSIAGMGGSVLLLHLLGWGTLALLVVPRGLHAADGHAFGFGLGLIAYTLGMRHAFDADHIAAIDNTTRKLLGDGRRPVSVGFWFSLGHSSIVFALCALLALGIRAVAGQVQDSGSTLHSVSGAVGTSVSGAFLVLIGLVNATVLVGIVRVLLRMRRGALDEATLEEHLAVGGVLARVLRPATRAVRAPWQMYPVGLLFGLGFDTATEVSLLVLAGGAAAVSLPWYAVLVLPVLFAAGMSLLDASDGVFMTVAYGWAFANPVRKVFYNLTVTTLSVAVALVIGAQELVSVVAPRAGVTSGPVAWVGRVDLGQLGFVIVGLFVVVWAAALLAWRFGRVEQRWARSARVGP